MALNILHGLPVCDAIKPSNAEIQSINALPKRAKATSHEDLKAAFTEHIEFTKSQLATLEEILKELGGSVKVKTYMGMDGLVEEDSELIDEGGFDEVIDVALISTAQRVQHNNKIMGYGCVGTYATLLRLEEIASKLQRKLDIEGEADHSHNEFAESIFDIENPDEQELEEDEEKEKLYA